MAIDTTLLTDYSWADIKLAAKTAMITSALGGRTLTMPGGHNIGRITQAEAESLYKFASEQLQLESSTTGSLTALANFKRQS